MTHFNRMNRCRCGRGTLYRQMEGGQRRCCCACALPIDECECVVLDIAEAQHAAQRRPTPTRVVVPLRSGGSFTIVQRFGIGDLGQDERKLVSAIADAIQAYTAESSRKLVEIVRDAERAVTPSASEAS